MKTKEKEVSKKKAEKSEPVERILGVAKSGTTKGNVLEEISDGKFHSLESLKECRVIPEDSIGWRITLLQKDGKKADKPFKIEELEKNGEDGVKLVFLNGTAKSSAKKRSRDEDEDDAPAPKKRAKASVHDDSEEAD
jgi:hypothetical protein